METLDRRPWLWLLLGAGLIYASQLRFGLGVLAWFAPVPWLHYLRLRGGGGARLVLVLGLALGWTAAVSKIATAPLSLAMAPLFGVPIGGIHALAYLGSDVLRRRLGPNVGTLSFAALLVLAEWTLHGLLPFGTWGALAHGELDNLALLQLTSVTGLHGVSFLMALAASVAERLLASWTGSTASRASNAVTSGHAAAFASARRHAFAILGLVVVVVAAGQARLSLASGAGSPTRRVAAIGTDSVVGTSSEWPDAERRSRDEAGLVRRTELAAAGGAELVVWNEAATMVLPENEAAFVGRLSQLARRLEVELVAAYVVPIEREPLRYENKYRFFLRDGSEHHVYFKHEPVPGEPAVRGQGSAPVVGRPGEGAVSGAICYDYDFPYLGRGHARSGVDLVALPSSDWRGIDPLHTHMAAVRAIEGGHSVLRSTRFGLSAGIDPHGRFVGQSSHFDGAERVLIVDLPVAGITTVYGQLGDWFPLLCLAYSLSAFGMVIRRTVVAWRRDDDGAFGGVASRRRGL